MEPSVNILVVDDEADILRTVERFLKAKGFGVLTAQEANSAYLIAKEASPSLVLADSQMPGTDGHQL